MPETLGGAGGTGGGSASGGRDDFLPETLGGAGGTGGGSASGGRDDFLPETLGGAGGTGGGRASRGRDALRGTLAVGGGGTGVGGAFEGRDDFLPQALVGAGGTGGRGASGGRDALRGTSAAGGGGGTRMGAFAADRSASLISRRSSAEFSPTRRKRTTSGHGPRRCASWILWIIRKSLGSGRNTLEIGRLPDATFQFYGQSQDCQPVRVFTRAHAVAMLRFSVDIGRPIAVGHGFLTHARGECILVASRRSSRFITQVGNFRASQMGRFALVRDVPKLIPADQLLREPPTGHQQLLHAGPETVGEPLEPRLGGGRLDVGER